VPDIDGSAIDLTLSKKAWKLKQGQRPTTRELAKIMARGDDFPPEGDVFKFEKGSIYLVQVDQHLKLPSNICGRASGKSSVGRLDVITRLITNGSREYDLVPAGYDGPLHLLLMPQTFTLHVEPGESVNQLRLFSGSPLSAALRRTDTWQYGTPFWFILKENRDRESDVEEYECWELPEQHQLTDDPLLFNLTVDLADPRSPSYVFQARTDVTAPIELKRGKKGAEKLDPKKFFETCPIQTAGPDRSVLLEPTKFYIMKSRERLFIPDDVAVEVIAISERIGDIRIHYAGFAHPWFGRGTRNSDERRGTPLIFEVRATDMPTKLYHDSILARIQLFRMSKPAKSSSPYEKQELQLSKVFAPWPKSEEKEPEEKMSEDKK
jgi:dCTP deaminase